MKFKILLPCFLLLTGCLSMSSLESKSSRRKVGRPNIILFIGDGMGPSIITGTRLYTHGSQGALTMESMPYSGMVRTYSADNYVTDSAASATALATGQKTYNRSIGMAFDPSTGSASPSKETLTSILKIAKRNGMSTGVVTTARITHATPACFYANVVDRSQEFDIAKQVETSELNLLMGGGRSWFFPEGYKDPLDGSKNGRKDGLNLVSDLEKKGWKYISTHSEMDNLFSYYPDTQKILGIFAPDHLPYESERAKKYGTAVPSLSEMVGFAITALSQNKNGYFLVVEEGRIDHAAHDNLIQKLFEQTQALDNAVKLALSQTDTNNTLVLVTADHDTAGLALNGYAPVMAAMGENLLNLKMHSATDKRYQGAKSPPLLSWATGPTPSAHRATFPMLKGGHTAVDVPIMAKGPGAQNFTGYLDNTDIPKRIAKLLNFIFP